MVLLALSGAAHAAPAGSRQDLRFEVYAGGINAVTASMAMNQGRGRYDMHMDARTQGLLGRIVPWEGTFDTEGWLEKNGRMIPERHRSGATSSDGTESKTYLYGKDGRFKSYRVIEDGKDKTPEKLDVKIVDNTTDALTAALTVMQHVTEKGRCEGSDEIFDGERRFRLTFHHKGEEVLERSRYAPFQGQAVICEAEVEPLGGRWHTKPRGWLSIQEQGRAAGSLPTIWMATLEKGAPAVPVRMRIKTDYGTLFMHMTGYANDKGLRLGALAKDNKGAKNDR
jgi:hypothetical protein